MDFSAILKPFVDAINAVLSFFEDKGLVSADSEFLSNIKSMIDGLMGYEVNPDNAGKVDM